jgi:hypothetical protein
LPLAAALEMDAEALAALWNELPLDDRRLAEDLQLTRQQVVNIRKSARERLRRRLKGFFRSLVIMSLRQQLKMYENANPQGLAGSRRGSRNVEGTFSLRDLK